MVLYHSLTLHAPSVSMNRKVNELLTLKSYMFYDSGEKTITSQVVLTTPQDNTSHRAVWAVVSGPGQS